MANILEYTLSLNDQMSGKLSKIGINSDVALEKFAGLEAQSKKVKETLNVFGQTVGSLREKLSLLRNERDWIPKSEITTLRKYNSEIKNLEKEITKLETINGSRTKGWFQQAFDTIPFSGIITNPLVIAGAIAGKAIKLGIEQDLQNTSFEVLLGGEQAAKSLVDDITNYANKTPYGKMELGDAAKTMLGFGIAQEKVMPNLKAIGDIAMGDANKMSSLALAFSQASSAGKLQGQDLMQMINAGFNPLEEMSRTTGLSMAELRKQMEKGGISAQMLEHAFISATGKGGQFYGMADKMSQTLGGKWSSLMDAVSSKLLTLYNAISPALSALVGLAAYGLDAVSNGADWLVQQFNAMNPVILWMTGLLGSLTAALVIMKGAQMASAAWTGIVTTANNLQSVSWWKLNAAMLTNPTTWIITGVIALIAILGLVIYKIDGWGQMWGHTVKGMKLLWQSYVGILKLEWLIAEDIILSGIGEIKRAWYALKGLWDEEGANEALLQMNAESDSRKKKIKEEGSLLIENGKNAGKEFVKAAKSLKINDKGISDVTSSLKKKFGIPESSLPGVVPSGNKTLPTGLDNNTTSKKNSDAIATGGTKNTTIHINIGKQVETINVTAATIKEGAGKIRDIIVDELTRAIAMGGALGS